MDFPRFIHVNQATSIGNAVVVDAKIVAEEIDKLFPSCKIDIRPPFRYEEKMIEQAKIADIKQPFEKQRNQERDNMTMMTIPLIRRLCYAEDVCRNDTY